MKKLSDKNITIVKKKVSLKKDLKPYMDYLGILNYKIYPVNYYTGINKIYIVETDYLETFILKIYSSNVFHKASEIEKMFINSVKNVSKLTSNINVSHSEENNLKQFLFTDRLPGANKKWSDLNANEKSEVIKEIAKVLYKIHTHDSLKIYKKEQYGKYDSKFNNWSEYLDDYILNEHRNIKIISKKDIEWNKFKRSFDEMKIKISSMKIKPTLLHGSISLNNEGYLRSFLFLGTKISAIVNTEESIFGDKIWDLVNIFHDLIGKNPDLEKDFYSVYGKLKSEELERLQFYKKILKIHN